MVNEETENRKALPDTTAIQKQGGALSKQLEIGILRRMLRDKQFDMPYKGFMEEVFLKGYVRASTMVRSGIFLVGIYQPRKPNKSGT